MTHGSNIQGSNQIHAFSDPKSHDKPFIYRTNSRIKLWCFIGSLDFFKWGRCTVRRVDSRMASQLPKQICTQSFSFNQRSGSLAFLEKKMMTTSPLPGVHAAIRALPARLGSARCLAFLHVWIVLS